MGYKNTQQRPGAQWTRQRNPEKPATKTSDPLTWAGMADRDPAGNKVTTNYPVKQESHGRKGGTGGKPIEGQNIRGYKRNQLSRNISTKNANDMAKGLPGGTTIRKISN